MQVVHWGDLNCTELKRPGYQFKVVRASYMHCVWSLFVLKSGDSNWIEFEDKTYDVLNYYYLRDLEWLYMDSEITKFGFVGVVDGDTRDVKANWIRSDIVTIDRNGDTLLPQFVNSLNESIRVTFEHVNLISEPSFYFIARAKEIYDLRHDEYSVYARKRGANVWWRTGKSLNQTHTRYMDYGIWDHRESYGDIDESGHCQFVFIARKSNGTYVRSKIVKNYISANIVDDLVAMPTISDVALVAMPMELSITAAQAPNVILGYNGSALWTVYVQKTGDTTWYHYDSFGSSGRLLPSHPTEFVYYLQDLYNDIYAKFVFVGVLSMDEDRWIRSNIVVIGGEKSFMDYGWIALIAVAFVCCFGAIAIVVNAHNHSVETKQ
eukprot:507416_1